ncbi:MAG: methyl-accepting chemotaxis protein [Gammaproteobacteria bacterium]|nr:methyl-accepting chemotaxis protein [Gammaproteobacteria bacterium]
MTPALTEETERMLDIMRQGQTTQAQMYAATSLLMVLERIGNNILRTFRGDQAALDAEGQLGQDAKEVEAILNTLLGNETDEDAESGEEAVSVAEEPEDVGEEEDDDAVAAEGGEYTTEEEGVEGPEDEEEGPEVEEEVEEEGPEDPEAEDVEPEADEGEETGADEEESEEGEVAEIQLSPVTDASVEQAIFSLLNSFSIVDEKLNNFLDVSENLFNAKDAAADIQEIAPKLLGGIEDLKNSYVKAAAKRPFSSSLVNILGGVVFLMMILLIIGITLTNRARAAEAKAQLVETQKTNERSQEAILRLLTEISDLADGDLRVNATVTEDFTGAIADALNFSIEAMRDLISSINQTSAQVDEAAQGTREISTQLSESSKRQTQQIAKASQAIMGMTNSVKKVSANATESADVAKKSVEIAGKGAKAVQATITGMDTIREQIQETSKRIKRLGESSQEIGEIVGLIDDISDQTNILALNAAIQAAMAGEAGRGFAVVADEVQRLAERAGNATKQIDALVKTIQSDTNEAVSSMEQSTANVVSGAKVAEGAGEALIEIETVSVKLAGQIESISQTSRTQAAVAANIAGTMTIIQEITNQASNGVNETASSIERVAELAGDLKGAVSGFTLP